MAPFRSTIQAAARPSQRISLVSLTDTIIKTVLKPRNKPRTLVTDFHAAHREVFAIDDPNSEIEVIGLSSTNPMRKPDGSAAK